MPDHYSPRLFLQQIPKKLLREFFARRGELVDLDWDTLAEADVDPILDAWHLLPLLQQADIERWFRAISALSSERDEWIVKRFESLCGSILKAVPATSTADQSDLKTLRLQIVGRDGASTKCVEKVGSLAARGKR